MMPESQYIFNDGKIKSRLVRNPGENWFSGEWKYVNDFDENGRKLVTGRSHENEPEENIWFPWICGTKEWLGLTEWEIANSYPPKKGTKK